MRGNSLRTRHMTKTDNPVVKLGRKDRLTLKDLFEGVMVTGATGSGKTSGSGKALREALLRSGAGILVLCAKPDEADSWQAASKAAGREHDFLRVDGSGAQRFNFLDYACVTTAANGREQNLIALMDVVSESLRVADATNGSGENEFFEKASRRWLDTCFAFLRAARGNIRLEDVYRMVVSAPKSIEQMQSKDWKASSFCCQIISEVHEKELGGDTVAGRLLDKRGDFWTEELPSLGDKTRSSIEATLTNLIHPFLSGFLNTLFCTDTTVVPEMARQGKIICLDLPALSYGHLGAAAQSIFKYLFGMAMQRQTIEKDTRPVAIWADEYQYFLSKTDAELLSTARSARLSCVFITQDIPTLHAQIGHTSEKVADSILAKFGTRVFHANTCRTTNQYAADTVGKMLKYNHSATTASGRNAGGSMNQHEKSGNAGAGDGKNQTHSTTVSTYEAHVLEPHYFAKDLRTGGRPNGKRVDAVLIRNGRNFKATGAHWLKVEFAQ